MAERRSANSRSRSALDNDPAHLPTVSSVSSVSSPTVTASSATPPASRKPSAAAPSSYPSSTSSSSSSSLARVTRSRAATQAASSNPNASSPSAGAPSPVVSTPVTARAARKRKTTSETSPSQAAPEPASSARRSKRQRVAQAATQAPPEPPIPAPTPASSRRKKAKNSATMSSPRYVEPANTDTGGAESGVSLTIRSRAPAGSANRSEHPENTTPSASSSRRSSRHKKKVQDDAAPPSAGPSRRSKRSAAESPDQDVVMGGTEESDRGAAAPPPPPPPPPPEDKFPGDSDDNEDNDEDDRLNRYDEDDDDDDMDPFGGFPGGGIPSSIHHTLRALTGMVSGISSRLREILNNLRQKDDPTIQLIALQELSELLLVSNEDNLSGHFSPDQFVKELVTLMQPNELTGEENPEVMLLACRCLANLMEALPGSAGNVVYGQAIPILCQKLLEIQFIDLAEQALSTLEKISVEYPHHIVKEGGLNACLSYLDFFATGTQRVAVTTAANCCRGIHEENFPVVRDVMPILLNVLGSNDQRVVEQASLCVTRIVESFRRYAAKLEELVSPELLKAILRLLLPGTTNLIGSHIHTQFLRVLAITAKVSPRLSAELFKMNVVETLYQILTGVSPPAGTEDIASKLDSVLIMQALIHRPREQIIETLNVICELLPSLPPSSDPSGHDYVDMHSPMDPITPSSPGSDKKTPNEKRIELLEGCKDEVRRFAMILFPTLTDAYSSTVNLTVRQKVLTAQLKMLCNLDEDILVEALKPVSYASFLASILSQQDHPSLVMFALQATGILTSRLGSVYRYQLYREGVIAEIEKLATPEPEPEVESPTAEPTEPQNEPESGAEAGSEELVVDQTVSDGENDEDHDDDEDRSHQDSDEDQEEDDEDDGDEHDHDHDHHHDDSGSPVSSEGSTMSLDGPGRRLSVSDFPSSKTRIAQLAKKFLETHETEKQGKAMKKKATKILANLSELATELEAFYLHRTPGSLPVGDGTELFTRLASYFDSDVLESVTSAELLASGVVRVLEEIFANPDEDLAAAAQSTFLQVFMGYTVKSKPKTATADSPATPLSVLVHKLQDLLSRSEHFEVLTVHHNSYDGNRSSAASMLAKQIRLKLVADEDSDIPRNFRNIMVSIHAITTFKSLDDYLRPRISMSDRPRQHRKDAVSRALAVMASSGLPMSAAAARLMERSFSPSTPPAPPAASSQPSGSRSGRKSKSKTQPSGDVPATPEPSSREKAALRRSARRQPASETAPLPPPEDEDDLENALECADEKQLSDDDEDMEEESALDVVGDLEEDMGDSPTPDPSAVNVEVAAGGKVMARKEDGTRVPTPSQSRQTSSLPSRASTLAAALQGSPTSSSSRPMSYAAAIQAVPQDWHIEFSINGKVIPNETTIYRAVHSSATTSDEYLGRNVWSAVHPIKFRRVPGPPSAETIAFGTLADTGAEVEEGSIPGSLAKSPTTASILRLLKKLHDLNANIDDVLVENKETLKVNVEPLSQFVNTKLTAKLNRQLEEPLIVASNCLPSWSEDLARLYPFLFPFETRHLFLQSTSFGYARSMSRWQNAQSQEEARRDRRDERPFLGRLQRQKVRIARPKILESAMKVMELYGASQSILEVEYFEEVGTGLGPTLEFYSTVSKEFCKKKLKLWRDHDPSDNGEFVSGPNGLFPRPVSEDFLATEEGEKTLQLFKILGKFVARSMIDSRIIDINFNPIFFRIGNEHNAVRPSLGAIKSVDPMVARSLMVIKKFAMAKKAIEEDPNRDAAQKVHDLENIAFDKIRLDDLYLDFTLPGYPDIDLIPNGSQTRLTISNVDLYLERVIDMTLGSGVRRQVDAFRTGFSQVFPYSALSAFTPDELCSLFGSVEEDWSLETLMDSIKADHGYNMDSKSVRNLLQTMSQLTPAQRRDFLQFTTGSPKLPIGGFKSLTPMFTVVCKPSEAPYTSDDYLPSVMTCVNYLKLPDYTTIDVLKKRLFTAIKEGQGAFHLS
ncbi:Ubiquitin fusion degradation protein 4 [Podospora pseudopauciseta]|uniref:HECT-type E3 ubiquitin transferase n=1 Tax=Podospora pseudopauciseta TaxID=2093780 RepID=A0ABR0HE80_9PEZI|nr:Ubiquitin fusion degradation protein 4 [Podospora pseudopauciseta]